MPGTKFDTYSKSTSQSWNKEPEKKTDVCEWSIDARTLFVITSCGENMWFPAFLLFMGKVNFCLHCGKKVSQQL